MGVAKPYDEWVAGWGRVAGRGRVVDLVGDRELSAVGLKGEAGMTTRNWNRTKFVLFLFFLCMF